MSDEEAPAPPPELRAPIQMWRDARQLLVRIWSIVGDPADLAQSIAVTRKLHALYASWLRVAETVMRHLLMIEAAALGPLGAPESPPAQGNSKTHTQPPADFLPDQPNTWRVSFRASAQTDRRLPAGTSAQATRRPLNDPAARLAAGLPLHTRVLPTRPLAQRLEAILRVFNDPIPYARRLARRLRAIPQLVRTLLRYPPEYIHRIDRGRDIVARAAHDWSAPIPDSS